MTDYASPTEELLRSIDVHQLLPQQDPFVMVGCLVRFAQGSSTTEMEIRDGNIFVENGFFSAIGMLENIAQTCAARIGYYNKFILHNEVRVGFIGAVTGYSVHSLAGVGKRIVTTVDVQEEVFGMTLASAVIECDGEVIATAGIKLAVR